MADGGRDVSVIIVGAGFGGIGAAIELQKHGFRDITILDAAPALGGTWFHNTYPGCACDVPSHLYSYSYEQRTHWSRLCSPQDEILDYLRDVARDYGVDRLVEPDSKVSACTWSDTSCRWTVETEDGRSFESDAVVIATGQLNQPAFPRIRGREDFAGHEFHTARWDHEYDLRGKRVAVIGTGASAVQAVPEIADVAGRLHVFQRTGNWFLPRDTEPYSRAKRWIIDHVPGVQAFRRRFIYERAELLTVMIRHPRTIGRLGHLQSAAFMRTQLKDKELRKRIWPDYTFGCKRILFSSDFLPALQKPNVDVVTDPIAGMASDGIVTADGKLHEVDCVIYATGFRTTKFMFPMEINGAGGRPLRDEWADGPHAHLGITVPDFPSLFLMYGPNTNTSGGSIVAYSEAQARYIRQALQLQRERGAGGIVVRRDVEAAADREIQARFEGTAWTRCQSWYREEDGRIVANWPGYMREYEQRTRVLDPAEFALVEAPVTAQA
jgi:cation diffusion facilitator CzcD-associated flavoprotein CzcO